MHQCWLNITQADQPFFTEWLDRPVNQNISKMLVK